LKNNSKHVKPGGEENGVKKFGQDFNVRDGIAGFVFGMQHDKSVSENAKTRS